MTEEERLEYTKAADMGHYGRLFNRLIEAVVSEYGIFVDDEVRAVYRELRGEIIYLEYALDEDFKNEHDIDIGRLVELTMPDEIDDIDSDIRGYGIPATGFVKCLNDEMRALDELHPRLEPFLGLQANEQTKQVSKAIAEATKRRLTYEKSLSAGIEEALFSISVASAVDGLKFEFINQEDLRAILIKRVKSASEAYQAKSYRQAVTECLSVVEALLVTGLNKHYDDARIEYYRRYPDKKKKVPDPEFWRVTDLILVARALGLLEKDFDKQCFRLNGFRNTIHVYREHRDKRTPGETDALHGFAVMSLLHDAAKQWKL